MNSSKQTNENKRQPVGLPVGTVVRAAWTSPSNIALVKYWGKKPGQLPMNPSLSITLKSAFTKTVVSCEVVEPGTGSLEFLYDSKPMPEFLPKIELFFDKIGSAYSFLHNCRIKIDTINTFPHSTGIASSASAMSALALCLLDVQQQLNGIRDDYDTFLKKASHLARIGSGSACRSIYPGFVSWGETEELPGSDDFTGFPVANVHPDFSHICDSILIVSALRKKVSSTEGHALMNNHPYAEKRFEHAHIQHSRLLEALQVGDFHRFIEITESEALALHAMMMTSQPSFLLLEPESLQIIRQIRNFREETGIPVCFTLDAGPNVHVIYPEKHKNLILNELLHNKIQKEFPSLAMIHDAIGDGPTKLN